MTAFAVFLRGVNVGGNKKFSPAALARDLAEFDVSNVGAAGTFVVRKAKTAAALRQAIAAKLPFEAAMAIVPGSAIDDLFERDPFPKPPPGDDVRRMAAVMTSKPTKSPRLPLRRPDGSDWQMHLVSVSGPFVLYFWRPDRARMLYTDVVDRELGVLSTSRSWNTIEKIHKLIRP